ncbi:dehydroascorbate reductase 2 [Tanacetum coccineum]
MSSSSTEEAARGRFSCYNDLSGQQLVDGKHRFTYVSGSTKRSHPDTTVGIVGMAGSSLRSIRIYPTRCLKTIITVLNDGAMKIGGYSRLLVAAQFARFRLDPTDMQKKRIVLFVGGDVCCSPDEGQVLGTELKSLNVACDVINFGNPYKGKREFFDTLIRFADNNGNCNVCHVPPESSVRDALSSIVSSLLGGGSPSAQSSSLQYHDKRKAVDIYLKPPSDGADLNTDCPFCQTVLLTLEEKGVFYNTHFIDLLNKPKGIPKQNRHETLPLIKFHDGTWVSNSDVIVGMIDKKYQGRSLATPPHFAYLGLNILPKLAAFLKTKGENDGSKQALLYELKELDIHISEHGPYVNGKEITAVDLSLAPKLYHLVNACSFYKNWNVLQDFPNVQSYREKLAHEIKTYEMGLQGSRISACSLFCLSVIRFKRTKPCEENVIEGWALDDLYG